MNIYIDDINMLGAVKPIVNNERKQKIAYVVFVSVMMLVTIIMVAVRGGCYIQNDDIIMRNIVSGLYTGKPDAHAVFIMYPLSFLLKNLYVYIPSVPWYGVVMVGCNYISLAIIIFRVGKLFERTIEKCIATFFSLLVILILDYNFLVANEFTVTSGILAAAAIFMISTSENDKLSEDIISIVLMTFSMWYRFGMFEMATPFMLLAMGLKLYRAYNSKKLKAVAKRVGMVIIAITVLAIGSKVVHNQAYATKEWKDYLVLNSVRAAVFDYDALQPYDEYLASVDGEAITLEDYCGLQEYKYVFLEHLSVDDISAVSEANLSTKKQWKKFYNAPRKLLLDTVEALLRSYGTFGGLFTLVAFVIVYIIGMMLRKREVVFTAVFSYGGMMIITAYCVYKERLPERVQTPLFIITLLLLLSAVRGSFVENKKVSLLFVINCVVVGMLFSAFGLYRRRDAIQFKNELRDNEIVWTNTSVAMGEDRNTIYLVDIDLMPKYTSAFRECEVCSANQIWITSWLWGSPIWEEHKHILGIDNIKTAFFEENNVCMITYASSDITWLERLFPNQTFSNEDGVVSGTIVYRTNN